MNKQDSPEHMDPTDAGAAPSITYSQPPDRAPDTIVEPLRISHVVRLRSGGCKMTLVDIEEDAPRSPANPVGDPDCTVVWTTIDGQGGQLIVPMSCLIRVDEAAEEAELRGLRAMRPPPTGIPGPGVPR